MKARTKLSIVTPLFLLAVMLTANIAANASPGSLGGGTATPIKHVVVIFQENVSTDHYFATYPVATNAPNEPQFNATPGTPTADGLSGPLLTENPNAQATGSLSDNPARLDRTQPLTCDNNHGYTAEQAAMNGGLMNMFPGKTGCGSSGIVMDYYDGNTVTALWNYAQRFSLSDNSFGTTFGPSTPGALNVVSGLGGPALAYTGPEGTTTTTDNVPGLLVNGQIINDHDPVYDDCSYTTDGSTTTLGMVTGPGAPLNIGNLLNTAGLTWGWFQGGFTPTGYTPTGQAICGSSNANVGGSVISAYSPHHEPFQFFQSTANPHHLPPSSPSMIGYTDQANHQYDLSSFWIAADSGNLPAVSYLKAPAYQDGHAGYSDPLDEQTWLVNTIDQLMSLPTWSSTAIIINWDDSDGWYDSVMPPIVNPSNDPVNDALNGNSCGGTTAPALGVEDRCGYGPRIPILVISPYAKSNYVDSTLASQTAIVSFIEYNWNLASTSPGLLGPSSYDTMAGSILNMFDFSHAQPDLGRVFLNPSTGEVVQSGQGGLGLGYDPQPVTGAATAPGIPDLSTTKTCTDVDTNPDVCATGNQLGNGDIGSATVWFSASADITPRESSSATTVHFTGQWVNLQLRGGNGIPLSVPAPNSEVVFSATATSATTTFTGGQWVTTVPVGFTGNVFVGGVAYHPTNGVSLAGAKADWTGVFSGTDVSFTLNWQWAGGIYSTLGSGTGTSAFYNALGVKPIDASAGSAFTDSDRAGTPENFVSEFVASATFNGHDLGAAQYTGQYGQQGSAYYQAYLLNQ
ncbi:MAG: alkaline phosphatase family protein [Nitrososphaerota archaeon]|nr:alkaline phosphatase family protein [Nitrososphaerota archaeon]